MCKALDELYEQGVEQGMERGIARGINQGRKEEQELSIKNLMETMKWSAQQAMDALKIPEEERTVYMKRL